MANTAIVYLVNSPSPMKAPTPSHQRLSPLSSSRTTHHAAATHHKRSNDIYDMNEPVKKTAPPMLAANADTSIA